jgi:hypothetical protein
LNSLPKFLASDVVRHHVGTGLRDGWRLLGEKVADSGQVGMMQIHQQTCLFQKSIECRRVMPRRRRD